MCWSRCSSQLSWCQGFCLNVMFLRQNDSLFGDNVAGRTLQLTILCLCPPLWNHIYIVSCYSKLLRWHADIIIFHSVFFLSMSVECLWPVTSICLSWAYIGQFNFYIFFLFFFFLQLSLVLMFFLALSPAQTTVPPGIATRQVSLYAISKISAIREICWAMCNNVGSQVLIFSALLTFLYLHSSFPLLVSFRPRLPPALRWTWLLQWHGRPCHHHTSDDP